MKLFEVINKEYETIEGVHTQEIFANENSLKNVKKITLLFEKIISKDYGKSIGEDMYKKIAGWIRKEFPEQSSFKYINPEDITAFSTKLSEYQDSKNFEDAGYFISVLINGHFKATQYRREYKIITEHLEKRIDGIGMYNKGDIIIYGNCGDDFCAKMQGGTSILYGNCEDFAGIEMHSGTVTILGNTGEYLGHGMLNGKIKVKGSAGNWCACSMFNGTIEIKENAKYNACQDMYGGIVRIDGDNSHFSDELYGGKIYENGSIRIDKPFITKGDIRKKRKMEREIELFNEILKQEKDDYHTAVHVYASHKIE